MSDLTAKIDTNSPNEAFSPYQNNEFGKILKALQTDPNFKAQVQNFLLMNTFTANQVDRATTISKDVKLETPPKVESDNISEEEDLDSVSLSDNKESDHGKITLAEKVKHDLANINSKMIKKKAITKKRWWTPEEVILFLS